MKPLRPIIIEGDIARVPLSKGYVAIIDAADAPLVAPYTWTVVESKRTEYARRTAKGKTISLHRFILGADAPPRIDHIDGDGLNCRRSNMRPATAGQNNCNSRLRCDNKLGLKGVRKHSLCNKYQAAICTNGVRTYLGLFETAEEAYAAYCKANAEQHKEFGRTA